MKGRAVLAMVLTLVLLAVAGSMIFREAPPVIEPEPTPTPPTPGEELWWSLPAELLSDVAEGKMEAIADHRDKIRRLEDELARVQEIQAIKMAEAGE